jgi:hypothetical protein
MISLTRSFPAQAESTLTQSLGKSRARPCIFRKTGSGTIVILDEVESRVNLGSRSPRQIEDNAHVNEVLRRDVP